MSKREFWVIVVTFTLVMLVVADAMMGDLKAIRICERMMRDAGTFADSAQVMWREPEGKKPCAWYLADR